MIKQTLEKLSKADFGQLLYALNEELSQYIRLSDNMFIGVHINGQTDLVIIETQGVWSYGRILHNRDSG